MPRGRRAFQPRSRPQLIARLRELGFTIEAQQELITTLAGTVVALAEEVDALDERLKAQEQRQPSTFIR